MANFAERIAYWYMRLNGCLLVENYVNHRRQQNIAPADTDLLAVRLKFARQRVGELEPANDDWVRRFGEQIAERNLGFIVQVKGGTGRPQRAFAPDRLLDGIQRIGAVDMQTAGRIAAELQQARHSEVGDWLFLKLVIGPGQIPTAHHVPLAHAIDFVRARFRENPAKRSDWNFLPDPIVQLIAWEECGRG